MTGLIIYTAGADNPIISTVIGLITTPIQKISTSISNHASQVTQTKKTTQELETELTEKKEEIKRLRSVLIDYYDIKKENAQFAKYYDLKQQDPSLKFLPGSVIGRDPNEDFYNFTIDQGSLSGVSVNDPVMTDNGLIGWVYSVGANFSKVKTILSPDTKVGAIDKVTGDSGVITGSIKLADNNLTKMAFIQSGNTMQPGDILVTSGLSGMYPKNLKIGEVKEITHDEYDASLYAVVKPYEDVRKVKDVFVVIDFKGKGKIVTSLAKDQIEIEGNSSQASSSQSEGGKK